jgi:hypothetical protein
MVLACAGGLVACGGKAHPPRRHTVSPAAIASAPAALCPSAAQVVTVMQAEMNPEKYRVTGPIVCDHGWATAHVQLTSAESDPTRVVLHYNDGAWRGITSGMDHLCAASDMHAAPAAIKKALGIYC